jgi:hypothetical protein
MSADEDSIQAECPDCYKPPKTCLITAPGMFFPEQALAGTGKMKQQHQSDLHGGREPKADC